MAASDVRLAGNPAPFGVAERLRTLRKHAGLTQTDLAGERFSKEYVSQIELGKTKPSAEAIEYLAKQLDVDPLFLETGVSSDERGRIEATLARGEALIEDKRYADAVEEYVKASGLVADQAVPELEFRALTGEAWAQMRIGEVKLAIKLLGRARDLAERPRFSDIDRADVLFRMGVCRYELSSLQTAVALFSEALELTKKSDLPLRSPQGRHLPLALTLLPPTARLGSRARGRRAGPRARRGNRRSRAPSPTPISRPRSSRSATATGSRRAPTPSGRRTSTSGSPTS